jgi:hypothetical protein
VSMAASSQRMVMQVQGQAAPQPVDVAATAVVATDDSVSALQSDNAFQVRVTHTCVFVSLTSRLQAVQPRPHTHSVLDNPSTCPAVTG